LKGQIRRCNLPEFTADRRTINCDPNMPISSRRWCLKCALIANSDNPGLRQFVGDLIIQDFG
jgi:hypothetical protein